MEYCNKKKKLRLFASFGIFCDSMQMQDGHLVEQTSVHCPELPENFYASFSPTSDTIVLFQNFICAFLSPKLVFFGRFFVSVGLEL